MPSSAPRSRPASAPIAKRLTDLPRPIALAEYDRCREAAAKRLESHPDVAALYAAGSVRHPGHSDLDLFVVLCDDAPIANVLVPADLPDPGPYLASHSFTHYPKRIFQEIHFLFPLFSPLVPLLEKEPIHVAPPPIDPLESRTLSAFYAVDYLLRKVFHLLDIAQRPELPVRSLLSWLHTMRYTLQMANLAAAGPQIGGSFVADVDRLRESLFELDPAQGAIALENLAFEGARIGFEAAWRLGPFFAEAFFADPASGPGLARFANREWAIAFGLDDAGPERAFAWARRPLVDRTLPRGRTFRVRPYVLPFSIARVFSTYARGSGPWSAWIARSFLRGEANIPPFESPAIERRVRVLDEIARLSLAHPLKNSYPYGFPPGGHFSGLAKRLLAWTVRRRLASFLSRALKEQKS